MFGIMDLFDTKVTGTLGEFLSEAFRGFGVCFVCV
jgi:hypothetical protein